MTIEAEQVRKLLSYDPYTGKLYHRENRRGVSAGSLAGSVKKDGYVHVKIFGREYYGHRLIWLIVHGYLPEVVDHANRDRSDNRLCNLRAATHTQNAANSAVRSDSITRVKGVRRNYNRWVASISINGRYTHLGSFSTLEEASAAYEKAATEQHKEFARA